MASQNATPATFVKSAVVVGTVCVVGGLLLRELAPPDYARMSLLDKSTAFMTENELRQTREKLSQPPTPWWQRWWRPFP